MLEKAGISPEIVTEKWDVAVCCAQNIARWWMIEHVERGVEDDKISYPGEIAMPQGIVPVALWLGMREFGGIWHFGRTAAEYKDHETHGVLGDHKGVAIFDNLSIYGLGAATGPVWRPLWYRSNFVDWAKEILLMPNLPNIARHSPNERENWCGVLRCPYPYVSEYHPPSPGFLLPKTVVIVKKESPSPLPFNGRVFLPRWGAHLRNDEGSKCSCKEREEEEEDVDWNLF
jgi:hypothetical protein